MPINEALEDQAIAHGVYQIRVTTSVVRLIIGVLNETDADIVAAIVNGDLTEGTDRERRMRKLLTDLRAINAKAYDAVNRASEDQLVDLAEYEAEFWQRRLNQTVGVDIFDSLPSPEQLRSIAVVDPIGGNLMSEWWTEEERYRLDLLRREIRIGMTEGQTIDQMVRRVRGSRKNNFTDGALQTPRHRAETIVRTAVNHVQTHAAEAMFIEHSDIVKRVRWLSTLDHRTSPVCMARDGKVWKVGEGPRPPAHPRCRSRVTPVLPRFSSLARPGALRSGRGSTNIDTLFRQRLKARGFDDAAASQIIRNARSSMDGRVPAKTTFNSWLKDKPADFQDEILGPTRAKMFRTGEIHLDRFVDDTGRQYTIKELREREAAVFEKAFG